MDDIRKFAVEVALGMTIDGSRDTVDAKIAAARKWESYLREAVPEVTEVVVNDDQEPEFELTEDAVLAAMIDPEALAEMARLRMSGIVEKAARFDYPDVNADE